MKNFSDTLRLAWPQHMRAKLLLVLCAIVATPFATAAKPASSYSRCMERSKNDVMQMVHCTETELNLKKAKLQRVYQKRLTQLIQDNGPDHADVTLAKDAQHWWEKYQEAECQSHIGTGGAWGGLAVMDCQIDMYTERIGKFRAED